MIVRCVHGCKGQFLLYNIETSPSHKETTMTKTVLRIDASASGSASVTRRLNDKVIARLGASEVITRDLAAAPLPQIDAAWNAVRGLPASELSQEDAERLALSDVLIEEIRKADTLVIGVPIYNFSVPASLKAWVDLVARPGRTFRYSEAGPEGLMTGKRAILTVASGGVPVGSDADFASGYMTFVLGFIGISDVEVVAADGLAIDSDAAMEKAGGAISALAA
jgi:FMN-dependent NADH-azoreductase